ncbi:hypothetical protein [Mesorhizobium xinjiangense]|uniref:hypothetical protein n=1 Tax=Mesorhizobium xinjiangense TaxID=2678685 RepID=UPI0012ED7777|nr:hypothetical protein [Mesorhizobium xinjiangense]
MTASAANISNAPWMRLVALVLAILLALAAWFVWQNADARLKAVPPAADTLPALGVPQAVSDCIDRRTADINNLVDQGFMDADAARLSLQNARSLCVQRN